MEQLPALLAVRRIQKSLLEIATHSVQLSPQLRQLFRLLSPADQEYRFIGLISRPLLISRLRLHQSIIRRWLVTSGLSILEQASYNKILRISKASV